MSTIYQQSRTREIYGATITLTVIATIAVILRFVSRNISSASVWWDDWTILITLMLYFGSATCFWIWTKDYGFGRHTVHAGGPVNPNTVEGYNKIFLGVQILYYSTSAAFKTSLVLLYYRLFSISRGFRYALAIAESIVASYFLACLFVAFLGCQPVSYYWDKRIPGRCVDLPKFYQWNGVTNLLIDLMILSLTLPMVWRLQTTLRHKITLTGMFLLGTFVFIASIVRVTTFKQLDLEDITYTNYGPGIWSMTEQSLGITCACLLTLRPLFGRVLFGSANDGGRTINKGKSTGMQLPKLSGMPTVAKFSGDGSAGGFARLSEENKLLGSITSYATTGSQNNPIGPETIVRSQMIEQHYDSLDSV